MLPPGSVPALGLRQVTPAGSEVKIQPGFLPLFAERYMRNFGCLLVQLVFLLAAAHVLAGPAGVPSSPRGDGNLQAVAALAHRVASWLDSKLVLERIAPDR